VPPLGEAAGLKDFEVWPWQGLVAPARTPAAIINKLHDTYVAAVNDPVVRQKLIDAGTEPLQSSPQEMTEYRRKEAAKWAAVIKTADLLLD
jgi:tripartite-type tricarboxylate transporter receptor subunit TctC